MQNAVSLAMLCKQPLGATLFNSSACMQKGPSERDQRVRVPSEQECVNDMKQLHVMGLELAMACGTSV